MPASDDSLVCVPITAIGGLTFGVSMFELYLMMMRRGTVTRVIGALLNAVDLAVEVALDVAVSAVDVDTVPVASLLDITSALSFELDA